jgi:hypothetical protein
MTLNSTGLGVGASPGYKLHVGGYSSANTAPDAAIVRSSSGTTIQTGPNILFSDGTSVNNIVLQGTQGRFGIWNYGAGVWNERLSVDSSGNVGVGVTPSAWSSTFKTVQIGSGTVSASFVSQTNSPVARIITNAYFDGTNFVKLANNVAGMYALQGNVHEWYNAVTGTGTAAFVQAMTLDASGNLSVGATAVLNSVRIFGQRSGGSVAGFNRTTSDGTNVLFYREGLIVGDVSVTTLATTYNSISDYRLKEAVQPLSGGLARVNALKPSIYKWKVNGSSGEGFLAHELAEVVPASVTGEKDAVNEDGSIKAQSIDMSRIVPILVAAIQELTAEVNALKNA